MTTENSSLASERDAQAPHGETQLQPVIPPEIQGIFGVRPLITGEDPEVYEDLLARVTLKVRPTGMIEWLWVKDVVDLAWEARRLRRLKAVLLQVARENALAKILNGALDFTEARTPARAWTEGDASAREEVSGLLREKGLGLDAVMAQALSEKLDGVERIERMIAAAEIRRDKVIREIESRRDTLARRLRDASRDIATDAA